MSNTNEHNFDEQPDLPTGSGENSFEMPGDYFLLFEDRLRKKLEAEEDLKEFPVLHSIAKINSFGLPEDYFSGLKDTIEAKSEWVNELASYTKLQTLEKINAFHIPENYFDGLHLTVKEKIQTGRQDNVLFISQLFGFIFGKKMALSIGIIVMIGFAVYLYRSTNNVQDIEDCKTLACLERQEIIDQNGLTGLDEEQLMELVNVKTLDKQLKTTFAVDTIQVEDDILEDFNTNLLIEEL